MKKIFFIIALAGAIAEVSAAADKTSAEKSKEAKQEFDQNYLQWQKGNRPKFGPDLNNLLDAIINHAGNLTDPDDMDMDNIKQTVLKPLRPMFWRLEKINKMGLLKD